MQGLQRIKEHLQIEWKESGQKPVQFALPTSPTSIIDPPDVQIGETSLTTVVKRVRNGIVSAIKICRRPTVSGSADVWRNEMEILNRLNHVSMIMEHCRLLI